MKSVVLATPVKALNVAGEETTFANPVIVELPTAIVFGIVTAPLTSNVLLKLTAPPTFAVELTLINPVTVVLPTLDVLLTVRAPLTVAAPVTFNDVETLAKPVIVVLPRAAVLVTVSPPAKSPVIAFNAQRDVVLPST